MGTHHFTTIFSNNLPPGNSCDGRDGQTTLPALLMVWAFRHDLNKQIGAD